MKKQLGTSNNAKEQLHYTKKGGGGVGLLLILPVLTKLIPSGFHNENRERGR
jgi:hypothetical protein